MIYERQNFVDKQVLHASQLNHMEDGIVALSEEIANINAELDTEEVVCNITRIESLDQNNLVNLRDLESGTYILYGKFRPYSGSSSVLTFSSSLLVNIVTKTAGTHVQVFYPVNNVVQFLNITDDSYERTDVKLNELNALLESSGTPSFNLVDLGLPTIPIDGTTVTVEADTTEIRTALDNGPVKFIFNVNVSGTESEFSGVMNNMYGGSYSCTYFGAMSGVPFLLAIDVTDTAIYASITPYTSMVLTDAEGVSF